MGKKGRCRSRTTSTVMKEQFPVSSLQQRRKQLREEFIAQSRTYQNERKQLEKIKAKVAKCQDQILTQKTAVQAATGTMMTPAQVGTSTFTKRKLETRKSHSTSISADNSEEFGSPSAKRSCQRRKKETLEICSEIHGGSSKNKGAAYQRSHTVQVSQIC